MAQLLDIAFASSITPAFLIAPVNQMGDRFERPNVGAEAANLTVQEALATMTGRMNIQGPPSQPRALYETCCTTRTSCQMP